jgi:hypothetical protein
LYICIELNKYLVDRRHGNRTLYFCGGGGTKKKKLQHLIKTSGMLHVEYQFVFGGETRVRLLELRMETVTRKTDSR